MIKKSEITHGAIFAIPLWFEMGFFYGKMLFGSHLKNKEGRSRNVFIRIYDYYTEEIGTEFDPDFFKGRELFVDPFILVGFPKFRGINSWKFLRHDPALEEDEFIHHYWEPGMLGELNIPDDKIYRIVRYGNLNNAEDCYFPYYRIKHLPIFRWRSYDAISLYLTFDWLKKNDKDMDAPFEYRDGLDEKKLIRFEVSHYATDYSKIQKEIRGRVAPV